MSGIVWQRSPAQLADDVEAYGRRVQGAIKAVGDLIAQLLESDARQNASWTDRTGQARRGLTGVAEATDALVTVYLFHAAEYGVWLELAHGGPYRIIIPTITANYDRIMQLIAAVMQEAA